MSLRSNRMKLCTRIAVLVFFAEAILLAVFALTVYFYCRKVFYDSMDFALHANAESLASLVEKERPGDYPELEFADEIMRRFFRKERPDLFAIILPKGDILRKSDLLVQLPSLADISNPETRFHDFENHGFHYRGVVLDVEREYEELPGDTFSIRVFFASTTFPIIRDLKEIRNIILLFFAFGLLVSVALAWIVSRKGLTPLRDLSSSVSEIKEDRLSQRLKTKKLPLDLVILADSINGLLERLERAFIREQRFSSDAAHELRTPVATLKSAVQAALLTQPDIREDRKIMQDLLLDVERLEKLCDSLLLITGGRSEGNGAGISADQWIEEIRYVVQNLNPEAKKHHSKIITDFPVKPPSAINLRTDTVSVRRISQNLVHNAVIHTLENTTITVKAEFHENEAEALLIVKDNGKGVDPGDVPHLFEGFYRADKSRSRSTGDIGLGLTISLSLARSYGGDIAYSPQTPHGSRFTWHCEIIR